MRNRLSLIRIIFLLLLTSSCTLKSFSQEAILVKNPEMLTWSKNQPMGEPHVYTKPFVYKNKLYNFLNDLKDAFGNKTVLVAWNGSEYESPIKLPEGMEIETVQPVVFKNKVYLVLAKERGRSEKLYSFDGEKLEEADTSFQDITRIRGLKILGNKMYFRIGYDNDKHLGVFNGSKCEFIKMPKGYNLTEISSYVNNKLYFKIRDSKYFNYVAVLNKAKVKVFLNPDEGRGVIESFVFKDEYYLLYLNNDGKKRLGKLGKDSLDLLEIKDVDGRRYFLNHGEKQYFVYEKMLYLIGKEGFSYTLLKYNGDRFSVVRNNFYDYSGSFISSGFDPLIGQNNSSGSTIMNFKKENLELNSLLSDAKFNISEIVKYDKVLYSSTAKEGKMSIASFDGNKLVEYKNPDNGVGFMSETIKFKNRIYFRYLSENEVRRGASMAYIDLD